MTTIMATATITVTTIITTRRSDTIARRASCGAMADAAQSREQPRHRGSPTSTRSRRRSRRLPSTRPTGELLRLGRIPFEIVAADGAKLNLLRVEIDALADVGSLTPHLGGGSFATIRCPPAWFRIGGACVSFISTAKSCAR